MDAKTKRTKTKKIIRILKRNLSFFTDYKKKRDLRSRAGIRKISSFHSEDIDEVWSFATENFDELIKPMQVEEEFKELLRLLKQRSPKIILEIGTAHGGTLFSLCKLAPDDATIISIDLPKGKFGGGYSAWKIPVYRSFKKADQTLFLIRGDAHRESTFKELKDILNGRLINFLFIDGDHSYEGVKKDFQMYSPLVVKGGIIAVHDIAEHPPETGCLVSRFWREITPPFLMEIIKDREQGWGGIGVLEK